ncbi:MAG: FGGY-family carbohydrate kinase [Candidatus Helarchaeota archaeon]
MSDKLFLAIDAGTTGCRSFLFNSNGKLLTSIRRDWDYNVQGMKVEFDPSKFWDLICENTKKLIENANIENDSIVGVSATSFREGSVFLDKNGRELLAVPAHDLRALSQGLKLEKKYGEKLYQITRRAPALLFLISRLLYLRKKMKDLYPQIDKILMVNDWIVYKLSGVLSMEFSAASETMLFDIERTKFSDELIELLEVSKDIFPPLKPAGTSLGKVTEEASKKTGLSTDTIVSVGGADSQCGLIGMGLSENLQTGVIAGSTTPIQMVLDEPVLDENKKTWLNCHLLKKKWVLESNSGKTGEVYKWLRNTFFEDIKNDDEAYKKMGELASAVPIGSNSFLGFTGAMIMNAKNPESTGASGYGGFLFPLPVSDKNQGLKSVVRSTLENFAFAVKGNILQLEEILNTKLVKIHACGGLTYSSLYNKILCDVLDKEVVIYKEREATGLGAAICATVGSGTYENIEEAMSKMVNIEKILVPSENSKKYQSLYTKWKSYFEIIRKI